MKKVIAALFLFLTVSTLFSGLVQASEVPAIKLGNEVLLNRYLHLLNGKKVGLVTNQSGVNSKGISTIDVLWGINLLI